MAGAKCMMPRVALPVRSTVQCRTRATTSDIELTLGSGVAVWSDNSWRQLIKLNFSSAMQYLQFTLYR